MNPIAKAFEPSNINAMMLRLNEEKYHQRNLRQITKRNVREHLNATSTSFSPLKKVHLNILSNLEKKQIDEIYYKKLASIHRIKPKPKLNTLFLTKNTQVKIINELKHKEINRNISNENYKMYIRMKEITPFFSSKNNDKMFRETNGKLLKKMSNIKMRKASLYLDFPQIQKMNRNKSSGNLIDSKTMFNTKFNNICK